MPHNPTPSVLVIDDDRESREVMAELLKQKGHVVFLAADGVEGLEIAHRKGVDVAVTDIVMPRRDGLETIQELRKDFPDMRIVAVSGGIEGHGQHNYLTVASALGADVVMSKPVDVPKFLNTVTELARGARKR